MTNREKFKKIFGKKIHWSKSIEPQMLALKSAHIDGVDCMEEWLNEPYREINNIDYLQGAKEAFTIILNSYKNEEQLPSNELIAMNAYACKMTIIDIDNRIDHILDDMKKGVK